jgi:hypothetical protein
MQSFELKPDELPGAGTDITVYLNTLFEPGTNAFGQLAYEIQREFRFGGSPDVKRLHIDRVSFDKTKGTGSFRVVLDIDFTFGCEDVLTQKQDQTSEWKFKVDRDNGVLKFTGSPFAEGRSTADEF